MYLKEFTEVFDDSQPRVCGESRYYTEGVELIATLVTAREYRVDFYGGISLGFDLGISGDEVNPVATIPVATM